MKKELKYLFFSIISIFFFILIINFYFSDTNKKKNFRSLSLYENKLNKYSDNLKIINSDTENILEYVENSFNKDKKKYRFWELIQND